MGYARVADTYLKVQDMDRAVGFYEAFLGLKAEYRYRDRWVSITDRLGLYNPAFDAQNMAPYRFFQFQDTEGNIVKVGRIG